MMKKLFLLACAALAFAACSDDEGDANPSRKVLVSFEQAEGMTDAAGGRVALDAVELLGAGSYDDVFCAKNLSSEAFDGLLFRTGDGSASFGSYFDCYEGAVDSWGGFALTANYDKTLAAVDYGKQFSVWADGGANGTETCAIGYDCSYAGGPEFARPRIEFARPSQVEHLYLANTSLSYVYEPVTVAPAEYCYKVVIVGSLAGGETGRAECVLVDGDRKESGWIRVDLSELGTVDRLTFEPVSNDATEYGPLSPLYFALDELAYRTKRAL